MFLSSVSNLCKIYHQILPFFLNKFLCYLPVFYRNWFLKKCIKNICEGVSSIFFIKTSGKSSGILLKITLHKKCFLGLFSYNNGSINIGKESKCCLYIEVGLHWLAYQMDVNLRRTSNLYKNQPWKKDPQTKGKRGKIRRFYIQLYIWRVLRFEIISLITKFQNTSVGVLFLIKLQALNCNCSEKILLWRCFWGFVFGLMVSNRKTHHMMSFVSFFFFDI